MMLGIDEWDKDFDLPEYLLEKEATGLTTRVKFDLELGARKLRNICLPEKGACTRAMSPPGGFSSCALVMAIARKTKIYKAYITTLRVGKKEADALESLHIGDVRICCGGVARQNAEKYDYVKYLQQIADRNGWQVRYKRNHSKVILLDTADGKIVIETSSNFNENPQVEQFCITNDESVYDYYILHLQKYDLI